MEPATIADITNHRIPLHAEQLIALVKRRSLTYDVTELYGEDASMKTLGAIVEDFSQAYEEIKTQSLERRVVSLACLVAMTNHAADTWIMKAFGQILKKGRASNAGKFFILRVLQPLTGCDMTDASYVSYVKAAEFIADAEKRLPWAVPCFIETYDIAGFLDLSVEEKYGVIAHLDTKNVIIQEVRAAYGKYQKHGRGEITLSAPISSTFEDIVIGDSKLAETRDGYVNVTYLSQALGESKALYNDYIKVPKNKAFVDSFKRVDGCDTVYRSANSKGTTWIHPKIFKHLAEWKGLDDLVKALGPYVDDTVAVESTISVPDRVEVIKIKGDGFSTEMRTYDGYCNLAELTASVGKKFCNISQIEAFHARLSEISAARGIPVRDLILTTIGYFSSSWGHMDVALYIVKTYRPKAYEFFEAALTSTPGSEVYTMVRDTKGGPLTRHRSSDGYLDANMISKWSPKTNSLSDFLKSPKGTALRTALEGTELMKKSPGLYGGTWVHPEVAEGLAAKGGLKDLGDLVLGALDQLDAAATERPTAGLEGLRDMVDGALDQKDAGSSPTPMPKSNSPTKHNVTAGQESEPDFQSETSSIIVDVRQSDGYVNATKLCKTAGKLWSNFLQLSWTSKFVGELERILGDDIVMQDDDEGTWVHPKMSLRLATWCGPEYETEVSSRVVEHLHGEIADMPDIPTGFKKNQGIEVYEIEEGEPLLGGWPLPEHFCSPVTFYIIQVGTKDKEISLFKWGISDDPRQRLGTHFNKYGNIVTRVLISVGMSSAKRVEDNVKVMMSRRRVILSMKRHPLGYESFKVSNHEADRVLHAIRLHVETKFQSIVRYSWMDGKVYLDKNEVESQEKAEQEITRRDLAIEQETTRRELAVLQATNDQLRMQLELAKLGR
jgi:hypothetical protein